MAEIWFYHLQRSALEEALPPLLEKCLARGWRALVRATSEDKLDALDSALWTYRDESFLPHGRAGKGDEARQPVLLTTGAENLNGAQALFLVEGAEPAALDGFARAVLLFDGADESALADARRRWKEVKASGAAASYWRESAEGRWEKQG
jgi:DNA polymerase III subunit chi